MKKLILLILVLFSCSPNATTEPTKKQRPNILFIEVDDLTAKYLGCFGAEFARTPTIDKLSDTGVVFTNAVVQGAMCTPSRNSLITTLYPHNLGLYHNLDIKSLPKGIWTFPKALQKEGYYTSWVGKNHLLPYRWGIEADNRIDYMNKGMQMEMGFDDVYQSMGRAMVLKIAKEQFSKEGCWEEGRDVYGDFLFKNNLLDTFMTEGNSTPTSLNPDTEYMDGHFTTVAIDKMRNYTGENPFFMWVNFSGPHTPFNVPKEYLRRFNKKDMPEPINPNNETFDLPKNLKSHPNQFDKQRTAIYRKNYTASIAYMDDQVGRLVDFVNTSKYSDNTVIVFFSDHGIMTGDHGTLGKETLFKEVLNPTLIISYPKKYKARWVTTPVELLDLGKTVLDIAETKENTLNETPNGNSLLPLLTGEGEFDGNGIVFSEIEGFRSVFNGDYKYIHNAQTPILFDLNECPDETNNVFKEEPEMVTHLKNAMNEWLLKSGGQIKNVVAY